MRQEIPIRKALNRGHLIINVPVIICLFGFPIAAYFLSTKKILPTWSIAIAVIIGFVVAWIVWSYLMN